MNTAGVFVLSIGLVIDYTCAQSSMRYDIEAEEGTSNGRTRNDVVYLEVNDHVKNTFLVHSSCSASVANLFYYSDGGSSGSVVITLDEMTVDSFAIERSDVNDSPANLWKIQHQSRAVVTSNQLLPGSHSLILKMNYTSCRGIEIDKTTLSFFCEHDPNDAGGASQTENAGGTPQTDDAGGTPQSDSVSPQMGLSVGQIISISLSVPGAIVALATIISCVFGCNSYCKS